MGDELYKIYKTLSMLSHPHDFRNLIQMSDDVDILTLFYVKTFKILESIFENYEMHSNGLDVEYNNTLKFSPLRSLIFEQDDLLSSVTKVFLDNNYINLAAFMFEFSKINLDLCLDLSFGFSEHGTTKWKYYAEFLAFLYIIVQDKKTAQDSMLLFHNTSIKTLEYLYNDDTTSIRKEAYEEFKETYNAEIDYAKFIDGYLRTLGFLIDGTGNVPSLKSVYDNMIKDICPRIDNNLIKNIEFTDIPLQDYLNMKYDESQNMSHANGYMFFTTLGAWLDGLNIAIYFDRIFNTILEIFLENEPRFRENKKSKVVRNAVRNYLRRSTDIINKKNLFYMSPKVIKKF